MSPLIANPTLATLRTNVRSRLDESSATFWTDAQLNTWINEGVRDINRRAEGLQSFNTSISVIAGTNKYALPQDVIRVHRVEFIASGDNSVYLVRHSTYDELDQIWGIRQDTQSSYPLYYCIWGTPGSGMASDVNMELQLYPVPARGGTLNLFYYRHAQVMASDGDVAEIPVGWDDMVLAYVEYLAKRKDRDPDWQIAKQEYEEKMQDLIDRTRQWHDQQRMIIAPSASLVPYWLYADDGGW